MELEFFLASRVVKGFNKLGSVLFTQVLYLCLINLVSARVYHIFFIFDGLLQL